MTGIDDAETRKKVLHYACCLLPEENRELMEVLFTFFNWISSHAYIDEMTGNKMDLSNMATVITPSILYSKSKDPSKDDSFLANEAVHSLLHDLEEFAMVRILLTITLIFVTIILINIMIKGARGSGRYSLRGFR
jgi:hypothetical protein